MFDFVARSMLVSAIITFGVDCQSQQANAAEIAPEPVLLWPDGAPGKLGDEEIDKPSIRIYMPPKERISGTAIVVCPGGGYGALAVDHEGHQIAKWLNSVGVTALVLKYRLGPRYHHPAPLQDAQRAIRYARSNAEQLGLSPQRIGIMGFSAGGHLASTAATHFEAGRPDNPDATERVSCRPDFAILAYPVISFTEPFSHKGSARNLLGDKPSQESLDLLSNEKQVTKETPPIFLFHTGEDTGVPPENSVAFYLACRKAGVPVEMHIYRYGPHGIGLSPGDPVTFTWKDRLADWLRASGLLADVQRAGVEGMVSVDGAPLKWGVVTFEPADSPFKPIAFAMVRNGRFNVSETVGPAIGTCNVRITGLGDIVPQPTEDNFQSFKQSLTFKIQAGKNEVNIDLNSK